MLNPIILILIVFSTIIGAFGSMYLKKGAKNFNFNILKQLKNQHLLLGIFLFVFSTVIYIYALGMAKLSLLYSITSLTYVWVALISIKFLGEKMNKSQWVGIALIILGIFMITYFAV